VTRTEFLKYHAECCNKMRGLSASKNADYCASGFAFENLCAIEVDGLTTTEVGIWTRFRDKTARLLTFLKGNTLKVKEETFEDTILDACNYLILLAGYLKYKRGVGKLEVDYSSVSDHREDPWNCASQTETVNNPTLGPITVHYGQTA
jgi:hypothetical protein